MAETNTRKKTPASDKPAKGRSGTSASTKQSGRTSGKASGSRSSAHTVVSTAASAKPSAKTASKSRSTATRKNAASSPSKTGKSQKGRDEAQTAAKVRQRSLFKEQFLPYILVAVGLFLIACFILDALSDATTASEHRMGFLGFYICKLLFGSLGWAAYLIPLLLVNLVIFWKRYCEEELLLIKVILSLLVTVFLSAVGHVFLCHADPALAEVYDVGHLFRTGYDFESGGVLGGLLGFVLYLGLKLPGTIVLTVLALPLMLMCLVGVTPAFVFGKLGALIKAKWQASAEEREARRDEEDARAEEDRKAASAESYRARRAKADAPDSEAPAEQTASASAKKSQPTGKAQTTGKRYVRLDTATGEMMDEDEPIEPPRKETPPAEEQMILPFYDTIPSRAAESVDADESRAPDTLPTKHVEDMMDFEDIDEPDFGDGDGYAAATPVSSRSASTSLPDDDKDSRVPEEIDTMDVDYDDEYEDDVEEAVEPSRAPVNYEVVTSAEELPTDSAKPTTTVRVLRSDSAALPEAGLSEEEVVLPTTFEEEPSEEEPSREYQFPPVELLTRGPSRYETNDEEIAVNTQLLRDVLESFHIRVKEISCSCGPTITRFEVKPESGIRVRSIANLVDDIAMNLAKAGVRIEAPIPGKPAVGIEVPNAEPATVYFRNILETPEFRNHKSRLAACLGADVSGRPVIMDINKMPHLLVAGTTGSGKSVCINSIIMSILYKAKPDEVKLILIDPKKVEFAVFRDLPHLYCPLISDPQKAAGALNSAVNEMERRFGLIEEVGVRNIAGYNEITAGDPARPPLPRMVIVIDELADLMMTASNDVETAICRLAQKGRAAGMHLILGTQRPSTDVITGLIKANVPSRIAFTVKQQIDSRIIIDAVGAEKLIGRGDMLYAPVGETKPLRVQGTFVSDGEVERVVTFIKEHNERGEFDESFTRQIEIEAAKCSLNNKKRGEQVSIEDFEGLGGGGSREDPKLWEAMEVIVGKDKIGTSALQRTLNLGYGRAAKIIDRMEALGFVGPDPGNKQGRPVYLTAHQLAEYKMNGLPGSGRVGDGEDE